MVGVVIVLIVMGGVVATLRSGIDLFLDAEANGKVTNGVRFTVASFKKDILPLVNKAATVEILKNMDNAPSKVNISSDYYIYISTDNTVRCRCKSGDASLNGSEYISGLSFSVPISSADKAANFLVNMRVEGQDPKHLSARTSADVDLALFNKPYKSSRSNKSTSSKNYDGEVLHFSAFAFDALQVCDASKDNKVLENNAVVAKNDALLLRYKIVLPEATQDNTRMLWYVCESNKSSMARSTGYYENASYSAPDYDKDKGNRYWPLLIKSGDHYYLAGDTYKKNDVIPSSSNLEIPTETPFFYVYKGNALPGSSKPDFDADGMLTDNSKEEPFAQYCYLRAWVVPGFKNSDGIVTYPAGYAQWSNIIRIQVTDAAGENFFNEWVQDLLDRGANSETDTEKVEHWQKGKAQSVGHIDGLTGEYSADISTNNGSNAIKLSKVLRPDQFADARHYDQVVDGNKRSYTSMTNYSIIIDAEAAQTTAGISLLLNGYRNGDNLCGYAFYYDPGANGYPIRLLDASNNVGKYDARGVYEIESPMQADIIKDDNIGLRASHITDGSEQHKHNFYNNYYNPQYMPAALQNDRFNNWQETASGSFANKGDFTNECTQMQARRRYKVTILEYYTKQGSNKTGNEYPRLIVRMQLLKNLAEVVTPTLTEKQLRKEDPFLDGPEFYDSEPAWYGLFVGQTPKNSGNTWTFRAKGYRNTGDNDADVVRTVFDKDDSAQYYKEQPVYYAVQTPSSTLRYKKGYSVKGCVSSDLASVEKSFNGGVYCGKDLCVRDNLSNLGTLTPDRERWVGIGLWKGSLTIKGDSRVTLYGMTIAPGFDESELRSIMPANAKVFGMDETNGAFDASAAYYSETDDTGAVWNKNLFGSSGCSDGKGNEYTTGINIYKQRFKNAIGNAEACVMSLFHSGSEDKNAPCPICRRYKEYQKNPIVIW